MSDEQVSEESSGATEGKRKSRQSRDKKTIKILSMASQNLPIRDIARAVEMPRGTVADIIERFKPVFPKIEEARDYRLVKSDILAAGQLAVLESALSPNKIKKAGLLSSIQSAKILNDMERLENDQSTSNVAHVFKKLEASSPVQATQIDGVIEVESEDDQL